MSFRQMGKYKQTYRDLCHGTSSDRALKILQEGFLPSKTDGNWCGSGIYFYDIKAKAWWSAERTCRDIKEREGKKVRPQVVFADIIDLDQDHIFDLRVHKDLQNFQTMVEDILRAVAEQGSSLSIEGVEDETERLIQLRTILIDQYATQEGKKLVIGIFRQRPQEKYTHAIEFADNLQIVFGVETIYCIKDGTILSNIH